MATATVEHHLGLESLPLIDLRLLSRSELLALSLCSSSLYKQDDDVLTPKIDPSVFNESAGSRKQTFSRLRLAPRNSPRSSSSTRITTPPLSIPQFLNEENSQIISLLGSLFSLKSHSSTNVNDQRLFPVPVGCRDYLISPSTTTGSTNSSAVWHNVAVDLADSSGVKRKRGRPRKNESVNKVTAYESKITESAGREKNEPVVMTENMEQKETVNVNKNEACSGRKRGRPRKNESVNRVLECGRKITESGGHEKNEPVLVTESVKNVSVNMVLECGRKITESGGHEKNEPVLVTESVEQKEMVNVNRNEACSRRKQGRPRKNGSVNKVIEYESRVIESDGSERTEPVLVCQTVEQKEMATRNKKGVVVDLVALGNMEDPFGEELRRRTEGMETEEELLVFLRGLEGDWVSYRKKRRIVDASYFGDALPIGWKLMLCIKKKAGRRWLSCRRYISPIGWPFMTCKEVSSYLLSFSGLREAIQLHSGHTVDDIVLDGKVILENTADLTVGDGKNGADHVCQSPFPDNPLFAEHEAQATLLSAGSAGVDQKVEILKCHNCPMTFHEQDDLLHHLTSSHQENAKGVRLREPISEGVISTDRTFESEFCHGVFEERHYYVGHLAVHMKNDLQKVEASSGGMTVGKSLEPVQQLLPSGFSCSEAKGSIVGACKEKYSCERYLFPHDGQDMKDKSHDKFLFVESCVKGDTGCNISQNEARKSVLTGAPAATDNVSVVAKPVLFNNENNSFSDAADETDVLECTSHGNNGIHQQASSQDYTVTPSGNNEACATYNNTSIKSTEELKPATHSESGSLVPKSYNIKLWGENIAYGRFSSIMELEVDEGNEDGGDKAMSGVYTNGSGIDDPLSNVMKQRHEGCLPVRSKNKQKCSFINSGARLSTSGVAECLPERISESDLPYSSLDQRSLTNKNLNTISFSTLHEPSPNAIYKSEDDEHNIGFSVTDAVKRPWEEKDCEVHLPTSIGRDNGFNFSSTVKSVSSGPVEVPKLDEVRNCKNNVEFAFAFGRNDSGVNACIEVSNELEKALERCLLVPRSNDQTPDSEVYDCFSTVQELESKGGSGRELGKLSGNEETCNNGNNVGQVFSRLLEEPKHIVESSWIGSAHRDVVTNIVQRNFFNDSSFLPENETTFSCTINRPRICSRSVEPKCIKGSIDCLFCYSDDEQASVTENNVSRVYTGIAQESPTLEDLENSSSELMIGHGGDTQLHKSFMPELMLSTDDKDVLLSGLADYSSNQLQYLGSSTSDITPDEKGV